jgi:hypothetical protein
MWIGIIAAVVITVLIFSIGANKKTAWHTKENKNVVDDSGSDGND